MTCVCSILLWHYYCYLLRYMCQWWYIHWYYVVVVQCTYNICYHSFWCSSNLIHFILSYSTLSIPLILVMMSFNTICPLLLIHSTNHHNYALFDAIYYDTIMLHSRYLQYLQITIDNDDGDTGMLLLCCCCCDCLILRYIILLPLFWCRCLLTYDTYFVVFYSPEAGVMTRCVPHFAAIPVCSTKRMSSHMPYSAAPRAYAFPRSALRYASIFTVLLYADVILWCDTLFEARICFLKHCSLIIRYNWSAFCYYSVATTFWNPVLTSAYHVIACTFDQYPDVEFTDGRWPHFVCYPTLLLIAITFITITSVFWYRYLIQWSTMKYNFVSIYPILLILLILIFDLNTLYYVVTTWWYSYCLLQYLLTDYLLRCCHSVFCTWYVYDTILIHRWWIPDLWYLIILPSIPLWSIIYYICLMMITLYCCSDADALMVILRTWYPDTIYIRAIPIVTWYNVFYTTMMCSIRWWCVTWCHPLRYVPFWCLHACYC